MLDNETFFTDAYTPKEIVYDEKFLKKKAIKKRLMYVLKILNAIVLIGIGLLFVYPFVWMFAMSLRSYEDVITFPTSIIVNNPQWSNYVEAWTQAKFSYYLGNSLTYTFLVLGLQYFTIIPISYAYAKMKFHGKNKLWTIQTLGMMLPAEATFIPIYFIYCKINLVDTWIGLILPSLFAMFGIMMFTSAIKQIPNEIIESAKMDKAKNRTILFKIVLPAIVPVLITHLLVTFISTWNEYYWILVMTNKETLRTLPIALRGLINVDAGEPEWQIVMAGNIIQVAPILILYILANQQVKNAMLGSRGGKIKTSNNQKNLFNQIKNKIINNKTERGITK